MQPQILYNHLFQYTISIVLLTFLKKQHQLDKPKLLNTPPRYFEVVHKTLNNQ